MTVIGLYHAGGSVLHRIPAGWKLLGMLLAVIGVLLLTTPWQLGVAAVFGPGATTTEIVDFLKGAVPA